MDNSSQPFNIDYIAHLARLELSPAEKDQISSRLTSMLSYLQQLQNADVSHVEPLSHPFPFYNVWREDIPFPTFSPEEALLNAPKKDSDSNQLCVPQVVAID